MDKKQELLKLAKDILMHGEMLGEATSISNALLHLEDITDYRAVTTLAKSLANDVNDLAVHAVNVRIYSREIIELLNKEDASPDDTSEEPDLMSIEDDLLPEFHPTEEEMAKAREETGDD